MSLIGEEAMEGLLLQLPRGLVTSGKQQWGLGLGTPVFFYVTLTLAERRGLGESRAESDASKPLG